MVISCRCSVVISVFAIVILSGLGLLFRSNHHEFVGGTEDPENGPEVAATIFIAVLIYTVSLFSPRAISLRQDRGAESSGHVMLTKYGRLTRDSSSSAESKAS